MVAVTLTQDMPVRPSWEIERDVRCGRRVVHVRSLPRLLFSDAHERQCQENHSRQTLERIRERGGLSAREALAILAVVPFEAFEGVSELTAMKALYEWSAALRRGALCTETPTPAALEHKQGWHESGTPTVSSSANNE